MYLAQEVLESFHAGFLHFLRFLAASSPCMVLVTLLGFIPNGWSHPRQLSSAVSQGPQRATSR